MADSSVKAMFKRFRQIILSIFIIRQDIYEIPQRTNRANGNICHTFQPDNFRAVQNLYQDKASMGMSLDEFKYLTNTCGNENYQPLTIDNTKNKYTAPYRLGRNRLILPDSSTF